MYIKDSDGWAPSSNRTVVKKEHHSSLKNMRSMRHAINNTDVQYICYVDDIWEFL